MISWMQRHKKYLVVTIWISVIAFVGAGFVGWGAYSFSNRDSLVAEVGESEIEFEDLEREYSRLYNYYFSMFGNSFNKDMAKKLKLQEQAMKSLIERELFKNLAREYGLIVLDSEVRDKLITIESFYEEGKFSKDRYMTTLNRVGLKPKEFEDSLKDEILIEKLKNIFNLDTTELEKKSLINSIYLEDNLKIELLTLDDINLTLNNEDLYSYWSESKDNYKSEVIYAIKEVNVYFQDINLSKDEIKEYYNNNKLEFKNSEGKILDFEDSKELVELELKKERAKKEALRVYLDLKKDKLENLETTKIKESNALAKELADIEIGDTLKPIELENRYIVLKLESITPAKILSFEDAKELVLVDFRAIKEREELERVAKSKLENFEGESLGFVSRDSFDNLNGLSQSQKQEALETIFNSKSRKSYAIFDDRALLFEILEQRFSNNLDSNSSSEMEAIEGNLLSIKNNLVYSKILDILQSKYEIKIYYKKGN